MDSERSSKKTRSYGGASKGSRNSQTSPTPAPEGRPQHKERMKSAPLGVPQMLEHQQRQVRSRQSNTGRPRRQSQTSDSSRGVLSSPSSPITKQHATLPQRESEAGSIHGFHATMDGKLQGLGEVQEVAIAVLGAPAVGKSTFVHCALDLKTAFVSPVASKKVSLEGKISIVRLLEVGLQDIHITAEQHVRWPERVGDQRMPDVDGVLALFDVMNQSSIAPMPGLLEALSKDALPTVLVSAKCDNPFKLWEVDLEKVESFCNSVKIEVFKTSASAPETHKRCISVILRNIMVERRQRLAQVERPMRRRALTGSQDYVDPQSVKHPAKIETKHARAVSEVPASVLRSARVAAPSHQSFGKATTEDPRRHGSMLRRRSRSNSDAETRLCLEDSDDELVSTAEDTKVRNTENLSNDFEVPLRLHPSNSSNPLGTIAQPASIDYEGQGKLTNDTCSLEREEAKTSTVIDDGGAQESGSSFDELVDRLLSRPMSKADSKFAAIFLCLYRKFAAPYALIMAIIRRFENLDGKDIPYLTRLTSQLRYLNILKDWVSDYPGDFAHPLTRRTMDGFVQNLEASQEYAVASKEINPYLSVVSEDDDTEWACSDKSRSRANTMESFLTMSSVRSTASTVNADSPTLTADSSTEDIVDNAELEKGLTPQSLRISATPSSASSISRSDSQSNGSFQTLLSTVENSKRQAQLLTPMSRNMLTKVQWHQFMEFPEEQIARELTRLDWIMFCAIKPRDLIRHVSLSADQKRKCKSLQNVNLMINHFNHVAYWVANMILLREKPKHRAKALERFMGVAWQLRYLNNYNSLGAIIAGINGTAVHRLAQTRELIPPQAQKQFMRLEILMGTQKGHFAYRLAYGNTSTQRIPFLPLHRRDLVLAEQGNRTYIPDEDNERINWKKFEIMGDVIIGIRKSQEVPYPNISRNEEIQRLVLDGRFCKDDDVGLSVPDSRYPGVSRVR